MQARAIRKTGMNPAKPGETSQDSKLPSCVGIGVGSTVMLTPADHAGDVPTKSPTPPPEPARMGATTASETATALMPPLRQRRRRRWSSKMALGSSEIASSHAWTGDHQIGTPVLRSCMAGSPGGRCHLS